MKGQIRKTSEFVTKILLYKGHGASRQKQEQESKQIFRNCLPSVLRDFAKHAGSQIPTTHQGSVIHVGSAAWWLHTSEHPTPQDTESCFYLLPGCSLLLRCPKSAYYLAHHKSQHKSRVNSHQLKTCEVKDVLSK